MKTYMHCIEKGILSQMTKQDIPPPIRLVNRIGFNTHVWANSWLTFLDYTENPSGIAAIFEGKFKGNWPLFDMLHMRIQSYSFTFRAFNI